jgi:GNAT superfamily N-acetyltransferase
MMHFVEINLSNIHLVNSFLERLGSGKNTFRYFEKRPIQIIVNHVITLLLLNEEIPVAYGHLDREGDTVWLGTAVIEDMKAKGYGKMMLEHLVREAKKRKITAICLTVDKENMPAISLYEKSGFKLREDRGSYFLYSQNLDYE